ncbi:hypothetical protein NDU88_003711 [Pleurodeles waltl]|uniref:Uncharacterized protein n=1 Tax=Pleurodeles waltl TaxID=8319 RepID=A0AAV7W2Y3_PLEWA|nr:hypothetical protein NDU88_003711 [Pleurodeles waltl]
MCGRVELACRQDGHHRIGTVPLPDPELRLLAGLWAGDVEAGTAGVRPVGEGTLGLGRLPCAAAGAREEAPASAGAGREVNAAGGAFGGLIRLQPPPNLIAPGLRRCAAAWQRGLEKRGLPRPRGGEVCGSVAPAWWRLAGALWAAQSSECGCPQNLVAGRPSCAAEGLALGPADVRAGPGPCGIGTLLGGPNDIDRWPDRARGAF